jgi:small ligand-binding sensory domain FIST
MVCDPDSGRAAARAAEAALEAAGLARADAGLVLATGRGAALREAAAAASACLGTRAVAAALGHRIAAGDREVEEVEGPAVAVLALGGLVGAASFQVEGPGGLEETIGPEVEAALGRSATETDAVVVLADPLALDSDRLAHGLRDLLPATVVGAGAAVAGPGNVLLAGAGSAVRGGACGLVLSLAAPARVAVGQGCRPIGPVRTVTRVAGHWVLELDGKPALDVYREAAHEPLAADLRRAAERLLVAIPRGRRGDEWVARRLSGFAPERRAFALAETLRVGSTVRLALRDADLAREDLHRALAAAAPARAAVYLGSSGRGRSLFVHAGLESALVARALTPAPVAALFGSFELAPLADGIEPLVHAGVLLALP